jgi:hypothetical protein
MPKYGVPVMFFSSQPFFFSLGASSIFFGRRTDYYHGLRLHAFFPYEQWVVLALVFTLSSLLSFS